MNPLTLLDKILEDWASERVRRLVHGLLVLAAVIVTIVLAAGGDWREALAALVAAIYAGANHANTKPGGEHDPDSAQPEWAYDNADPELEYEE